jgi:carbon monoxide dehydrogenase subunit G
MPHVTVSVEIAAPVEEVFTFVADRPERATSFLPGLARIDNVTPAEPGPGQTWDFEFDWFGLVISGRSRCTVLERPRQFQFRTETGSKSTWDYAFAPSGSGTRVTLDVDYEVPANLLARYASAGALEKMNHDRAAQALANLKGLLEG